MTVSANTSLDIDETAEDDPNFFAQDAAPPAAPNVTEERQRRKLRLALAFRAFARYGFDEGDAGHISVRDPEHVDHFWVNPWAVHFSRMKVSDLLLVNERGRVVEGKRRIDKAAFSIHSAIHRARPEVTAVAHAHSIHGRALAALDRPLDPVVQEACAFYNDHVIFREYGGMVRDLPQGRRIAECLAGNRAIILRNHGLITVGRSVEEAAWWFITMDRSARIQLLAEAANGEPRLMTHEEASLAHRQFGSPNMARQSFTVLSNAILDLEPDTKD
jgi:ribulose-5-phosphate 4-epimerase/fuculose-1-phosphate aldolase